MFLSAKWKVWTWAVIKRPVFRASLSLSMLEIKLCQISLPYHRGRSGYEISAIPAFVLCPYLCMFEIWQADSNKTCTPNAILIQWLHTLYEPVEFAPIRLIPFVVLCWCYFHVARFMCRVCPTVSVTGGVTQASVIFQSKRRVTRTAGMFATAYTLCWRPTFIMTINRKPHVSQPFNVNMTDVTEPMAIRYSQRIGRRVPGVVVCPTNIFDSIHVNGPL